MGHAGIRCGAVRAASRRADRPGGKDALRAEIRTTLHTWGAALLADPDGLDNGWRQPHVVTSIARMLHSLQTGRIHSKKASVEWACEHMEPRWTPLLKRAWAKHPQQFLRYHERADPDDLKQTLAFIRFALEHEPPRTPRLT